MNYVQITLRPIMYFMPFWGIWRGLFGPSSFWVFFQPFYYCLLILVFCSVSFFCYKARMCSQTYHVGSMAPTLCPKKMEFGWRVVRQAWSLDIGIELKPGVSCPKSDTLGRMCLNPAIHPALTHPRVFALQ